MRHLTKEELTFVSGGAHCDTNCPPKPCPRGGKQGNNGFGNGGNDGVPGNSNKQDCTR